ncbi:hypothetical protein [Photobacterium profundum]|uniref:hypothetical protein n=1 Tax=Photobacterium profundum TaxID=74109 RepID=UPI00059CF010|nr:hypothetical protein [Photobacterium profundum]
MLDKPVGFIPYDKEAYQKAVGFSFDYQEVTWGDKIVSVAKLRNIDRRYCSGEKLNILNITPNAQDIDHLLNDKLEKVVMADR